MLSSCARASKVLVVDPDRAVLAMLQIRLDVAGRHPLVARSGVGALEILRDMRPSALVLDTAVAEMGAFDVLALIQRDRAHPACPILPTGKKPGAEEVRRASTLGVQASTVKPYGGADVLERIAKLLKAGKPISPADDPVPRRPASCGPMEVVL